ncbi:hypothetical protein T440DRAFT_474172 [Plenodomus tracheiphilus IPT5]|uniref:Uncharacterized protein n=1 Tax=Plenodomus tracheiphilus IPT5 TaxID=1408161 RepID=A0A6A7BQD2_9PLEO|nr:hypothetical protein T440DRAFT_474172 [Plenodomus tracheiphilus IPT5]
MDEVQHDIPSSQVPAATSTGHGILIKNKVTFVPTCLQLKGKFENIKLRAWLRITEAFRFSYGHFISHTTKLGTPKMIEYSISSLTYSETIYPSLIIFDADGSEWEDSHPTNVSIPTLQVVYKEPFQPKGQFNNRTTFAPNAGACTRRLSGLCRVSPVVPESSRVWFCVRSKSEQQTTAAYQLSATACQTGKTLLEFEKDQLVDSQGGSTEHHLSRGYYSPLLLAVPNHDHPDLNVLPTQSRRISVYHHYHHLLLSVALALFCQAAPATALPQPHRGKSSGQWSSMSGWLIGGIVIGILVLALASVCVLRNDRMFQRLRQLPGPVMTFSSLAFITLRNGDAVEARVAWL